MRRISAVRMVLETAAVDVYWPCYWCLKMGQEKEKKHSNVLFRIIWRFPSSGSGWVAVSGTIRTAFSMRSQPYQNHPPKLHIH
jgi:hypothetical protein